MWCVEYNIKTGLTEIVYKYVDWISLTQNGVQQQAVVDILLCILMLQKVGNFLTS
jgi:hypothetical protein